MPGLRQRKAARMAQHMRMHAEAEASGFARARNQLVNAVAAEGSAALACRAWIAARAIPFARNQWRSNPRRKLPIPAGPCRYMVKIGEDKRRIPRAVAIVPGGLHEPEHFVLGKMLPRAIGRIGLAATHLASVSR